MSHNAIITERFPSCGASVLLKVYGAEGMETEGPTLHITEFYLNVSIVLQLESNAVTFQFKLKKIAAHKG